MSVIYYKNKVLYHSVEICCVKLTNLELQLRTSEIHEMPITAM